MRTLILLYLSSVVALTHGAQDGTFPSPTPINQQPYPIKDFETSTTYTTTDNVPSATMTVESRPTLTKIPWATATQANGDVVFPVTPEEKQFLQGIFDKVSAACGGAARMRKRTGPACEPNAAYRQFQSLGNAGGPLEFDLPISLSIPLVTAGDVAVLLQSAPAPVVIAFLAWLMAPDGKVNDKEAVKVKSSEIKSTSTSQSTSKRIVPTTTNDDQLNSVYTAADNVYTSIAQAVLSSISTGWSSDQSLWDSTPTPTPSPEPKCDDETIDMDANIFKKLGDPFCKDIELSKKTEKIITNHDAGVTSYASYTFDLKWEPKQGKTCKNVKCEDLFNGFATTCTYNDHSMHKSGHVDLDCGTASYLIGELPTLPSPPTTSYSSVTPTPTITVGTPNCIPQDPPANLPCWKNVHKDEVEETLGEFSVKRIYQDHEQNLFNAQRPDETQVLRHGSGVTYMMQIRWIAGCTIVTQQYADNPVPDNPSVNYQDLLKNNYYLCTNNAGLGGYTDVGCLQYGFYPNNANTFGSPPHPENYLNTMKYCGG